MKMLPSFRSRRRPRVLDGQVVRVEGSEDLASISSPARIALIAHWAPDNRVSRSVVELTRALTDDGFAIVLVSTAEEPGPLAWYEGRPEGITVLRRGNVGYDFGSWATALNRYPHVADADEVLLVNDSLAGPFRSIGRLLGKFHGTGADVWGITDTTQHTHHLQSYCLGFKHQVLREAPLAAFWRNIRVEPSRDDVIQRYELGLGRMLHREAYSLDPAIPYRLVVGEGCNPTIHGWKRLLDLDFPFVKRELLRKPEVAADGEDVREEIANRFGVEVSDWV